MRKLLLISGVIAFMAMTPVVSSAQKKTSKKETDKTEQAEKQGQTLQEATDSLNNIIKLAESGNASAQNELGRWYYMGIHTKQDYTKALEWWARAAQQGDAAGIANMALCYQTGHGVTADSVMAVKLYQNAIKKGYKQALTQNAEEAKKGSVFANMFMAQCYLEGVGVTKDANKAIPYLTAAAKKHSLEAIRTLGLLYLNGNKDKEAAEWFKKGSEEGDISSTYWYGKMLLDGKGLKQDKKDGVNYLIKAADKGFPQAMYVLGTCYMEGQGVTKNPEQGLKWYKLASGRGVVAAQWALANCYREGIGTEVNYNQALERYAQASSKGYARSFKNLITDSIPGSPFVAYLKGMKAYAGKDFDEALKQFKIVEKAKIADGKVMEAAIYANADYSKANIKKGVKLLKDAAKTNSQALYLLGGIYQVGKGVDKDMETAVDYMKQAADKGYGPAECALGDMYFEGVGVGRSYDEAVRLYQRAYAQGELSADAAKRLALCYEEGKGGLEPNKQKAEEILKDNSKNPVAELLKSVN